LSVVWVICISLFCVLDRESPVLRLLPCRAVHFNTCCPVETSLPHQKYIPICVTVCPRLWV